MHWWSPKISSLRKTANHLRKTFQRKRKRYGSFACTSEEEVAKEAKRNLVIIIRKAKDIAWKNLCNKVEKDPWRTLYKLIMDKFVRPMPIPGINILAGC